MGSLLLVAVAVCVGLFVGVVASERLKRKRTEGNTGEHQELAEQLARAERLNVEITVSNEDRVELLQARARLRQARYERERKAAE